MNMPNYSTEWNLSTMNYSNEFVISTPNNFTDPTTLIETNWKRIVIGVVLCFVVIATILGNVLVLFAIYREKRLQTKFNYYIVNLAITDFSVAATAMSFYSVENILGYWPFGEFMCGVWIFCDYGMTFASVFTLLVISMDRFWSVTWRMHYRLHNTKRKCVIFIIGIWIFMVILWLPPCIMDRMKNSSPMFCKWDPAYNQEFVIIIATIGHHGSCFVMLFCYIKVFHVLRKRAKIRSELNGNQRVPRTVDHPSTSHHQEVTQIAVISELPSYKDSVAWTETDVNLSLRPPQIQKNGVYRNTLQCPREITTSKPTSDYKTDGVEYSTAGIDGNAEKDDERSPRSQMSRDKRDAKVFKTLTYILVGYVICWVPFHIVFDISSISPDAVPEIIYTITFWMTYLNSTINPFLYNFSSPEFKRAFKKILFCR